MPLERVPGGGAPALSGVRGAQRHDAGRAQRAHRGHPARAGRRGGTRRRPRAAATRTRCAASARPTPKRRAALARSSCRACGPGAPRVGGRHGSALRVAREIYGVVFRYWASLVGVGRQELSWPRRLVGLGFSAASLPAEFIPALVAVVDKTRERARVAAYRREWGSGRPRPEAWRRAAHGRATGCRSTAERSARWVGAREDGRRGGPRA